MSNSSRVFSIIDSSYFPNIDGILSQFDVSLVHADFDIPACAVYIQTMGKTSNEFPCCASLSCLYNDYLPNVLNNDNHLFVVQSFYDSYLFRLTLIKSPPTFGHEDAPPEAWLLHTMSALRTSSLISNEIYLEDSNADEDSKANSYVTSFQPACGQHIYMCQAEVDCGRFFVASTLDGEYRAEFKISIHSSNWNSVSIDGTTIQEAIVDWFNFAAYNSSSNVLGDKRYLTVKEKNAFVSSSLTHVDTCSGLNCNPTCPGDFLLTAVVKSWDWDSFELSMILLAGFSSIFIILSIAVFISGNSILPYKFLPTTTDLCSGGICCCADDDDDDETMVSGVDKPVASTSVADDTPRNFKSGGKRVSVMLNKKDGGGGGRMLDRKTSLTITKGMMTGSALSHMNAVLKPLPRSASQELDAIDALNSPNNGGAGQQGGDDNDDWINSPSSYETPTKGRSEERQENRTSSLDRIPVTLDKRPPPPTTTTSTTTKNNMSIEKELASVLGGDEAAAVVALSSPHYDHLLQDTGPKSKLLRQYSRKVHGPSDRNETPSKLANGGNRKTGAADGNTTSSKNGNDGRVNVGGSRRSIMRSSSTDDHSSSSSHHHHGSSHRWRRHAHKKDHQRSLVQAAEEKGLVANIDVVRLNYDIDIKTGAKKGQKKRLLHDVNVHFPACSLTAIMGSSGWYAYTHIKFIIYIYM
jgi:hypothetical protein